MKQPLLLIIAALMATAIVVLSLVDMGRRNVEYRGWNVEYRAQNVELEQVGEAETNATAGSLSALPEAGSPLSAPPAMLEVSAMMELTPVQLLPLDAGMVNVTRV